MKLCSFIFCFTIAKAMDEWKSTQVLIKNDSEQTARNPKVAPTKITPTFEMMIKHSHMWVDKSLIIREMWNSPGSVFIVTAPRRWGKTTIASMIGYYHELPLNKDGSEGDRTTSENYLYFTEGKIFDYEASQSDNKPLISTETSLNNEHLANHPVIYLSGNHLDIADDFLDGFRSMIEDAYQRHYSLRMLLFTKSSIETDDVVKGKLLDDLKNFDKYHTNPKTLNEDDLICGISILSRLLKNTYQKDVVIIFDEYDAFICNSYFLGRVPTLEQEGKFVEFLKLFMSKTFKENKDMIKSIITGILPIRETTGLSGLNGVPLKYVFGKDNFFPYYGIFENEFYKMVDIRGENQSSIHGAVARYDGYRVLSHPNTPMFSTFSVIRFIGSHAIENYWSMSGLSESLIKFFEHEEFTKDIARIVGTWKSKKYGVTIRYDRMLQLSLDDFRLIHSIAHNEVNYTSAHRETIFSFLVSFGYFSIWATTDEQVAITIPNIEIFMDLKSKLLHSIHRSTGLEIFGGSSLKNFMKGNDSTKLLPLARSISTFILKTTRDMPPTKINKAVDTLSKAFHRNCTSGDEKTFETLVMSYFLENTKHRAVLEDHTILEQQVFTDKISLGQQIIDIFFADDYNAPAIVVELKYVHTENPKIDPILDAFRQCLRYMLFFRPFKNLDVPVVHFMAMTIYRNSTIELMSIGVKTDEIMQWKSEAVRCVEQTPDKVQENLCDDWSSNMFVTLNQTMPARIWYTRYDPNLSPFSA